MAATHTRGVPRRRRLSPAATALENSHIDSDKRRLETVETPRVAHCPIGSDAAASYERYVEGVFDGHASVEAA